MFLGRKFGEHLYLVLKTQKAFSSVDIIFSFIISVFTPRRTLVRLNGAKNEDSHENLLFNGFGALTVLKCKHSVG